MAKAVSLFSGSISSILATSLIIQEKGIDEIALITFRSPFFEDYQRVKEMANELWPELPFRSQSVKKKCERLSNIPEKGSYELHYSCKGCRSILINRGKRFMERVEGDFLVTGELVGRNGLGAEELTMIDRKAGAHRLVFRPLSANLLPETTAQQEGWVTKGFALRDGDEGPLDSLAKDLFVDPRDFNFPAEKRCKLTDKRYRKRLEDLLDEPDFTTNALKLLEFEQYYKVQPDIKIVLGMSEEEKRELQNYFLPHDLRVYLPSHKGPMTLVRTNWKNKSEKNMQRMIQLAARITVFHSEARENSQIPVNYRFENDSDTYRLDVSPMSEQELSKYRVNSRIPT